MVFPCFPERNTVNKCSDNINRKDRIWWWNTKHGLSLTKVPCEVTRPNRERNKTDGDKYQVPFYTISFKIAYVIILCQ